MLKCYLLCSRTAIVVRLFIVYINNSLYVADNFHNDRFVRIFMNGITVNIMQVLTVLLEYIDTYQYRYIDTYQYINISTVGQVGLRCSIFLALNI